MKNNLIFYFVCCLLIFNFYACSNDSADSSASTKVETKNTATAEDAHAGHNHNGEAKVHKASTLSPFIGMWEYSYTMKIRDKNAHDKNKGRWIKFEGDKTFVSGRWDKTLNKGTWDVSEDGLLSIDYEDHLDQTDRVWKTQGVGGDVVIWNGTKENNATGTSMKMSRIETFPVQK